MSRLFSIIVSLFILFLVYLWIGHITNRDDDAKPTLSERNEASRSTPSVPNTASIIPDESETQKVEEPVEEVPVEAEEPESQPPVAAPSSKGNQLVIAGNFLERANAEKHLRTIRELGYTSSEILQFEISQYYTVCAGRYDDPTEARRVAKLIEDNHGIDTYVRQAN